jgi:AcrR family transcriptional regulator
MGRPSRIDRATVLSTGLALADEVGLEALTMGAVASRLGVTPMALYRHVANKADLLDGIVGLLLTDFSSPPPDVNWVERLSRLARAIRASARRHPSVFPLLLERPVTTPEARRVRDGIYAALREGGVGSERVAQIERLVSTAILGFVVSEAAGRFRYHSRRQLDADFDLLQALLGQFIGSEASAPSSILRRSSGPSDTPVIPKRSASS